MKSKCKSCGFNTKINPDHYASDHNEVSETLYEQRLDTCMQCSSLIYGNTCKHSGYIVFYKTMLEDQKCPHPKLSKW